MEVLNFGKNQYKQVVYLCRQDNKYSTKKVQFNVGLTWLPTTDSFEPYCICDLPETLDKGKGAKVFSGKEKNIAIKYAKELSEKYNLKINECLD